MSTLLPADQDPYVAWRGPLLAPDLRQGNTVLLAIDMQFLDADWDSGMCRRIWSTIAIGFRL